MLADWFYINFYAYIFKTVQPIPANRGRKMQFRNLLPETGYLRLTQIIGNKRTGAPPIIPVSRSTWLAGVKNGRYPEPIRTLGNRITAWRVEDIRALIESANKLSESGKTRARARQRGKGGVF